MGKSFANGNGGSYANSMSNGNGPALLLKREGWDIRPVTSWTLTIGQDPA